MQEIPEFTFQYYDCQTQILCPRNEKLSGRKKKLLDCKEDRKFEHIIISVAQKSDLNRLFFL